MHPVPSTDTKTALSSIPKVIPLTNDLKDISFYSTYQYMYTVHDTVSLYSTYQYMYTMHDTVSLYSTYQYMYTVHVTFRGIVPDKSRTKLRRS